jgi:hypothetical protein
MAHLKSDAREIHDLTRRYEAWMRDQTSVGGGNEQTRRRTVTAEGVSYRHARGI